jgi:sulfonate transport system permease protein
MSIVATRREPATAPGERAGPDGHAQNKKVVGRTLVDLKADGLRAGRHRRIPRLAIRIAGPLAVVGLWQLLSTLGVFSQNTIPSPASVFTAGQQLMASGQLQSNFFVSLERVGIGLIIGTSVGLVLALVSGFFRLGEDLLDPLVQIFRSVPILGLIPLVIIWFGVGETAKIFLIALGCVFPVYINTHAAIRGIDAHLAEMGSVFGLSRLGMAGRVIFPGALPGFFVGIRFALVGCWLIVVVAEEINSQSGLGYLLAQAQTSYRTDIMVLVLAIYGCLGIVADLIVRLLERGLLSWRRGFQAS